VNQTIASLIGAQASLKTFALQTKDQNAKKAYESGAEQIQQVIDHLMTRLKEIEMEEPQYKN
jgi:hypothetical protein